MQNKLQMIWQELAEILMHIPVKNVEEVLLQWGITNPTITDIYINSTKDRSENTWFINNDMVLKIGVNMKGLTNHILISKLMIKNGLCAAAPIVTLDDRDYYTDGDLYYFLSKKLEGKAMNSTEFYKDNYKEQAFYHGEIIGKLHKVLLALKDDILCKKANIYEDVTKWAIPKTNEVFGLSPAFINDYKDTMSRLINCLPKQIIHRDPNPDNILFHDNKLVGFIDFEITEVNVRIFDPCYAATLPISTVSVLPANSMEKLLYMFCSPLQNLFVGDTETTEKSTISFILQ